MLQVAVALKKICTAVFILFCEFTLDDRKLTATSRPRELEAKATNFCPHVVLKVKDAP